MNESVSAKDLHQPVLVERCLDLLAPAIEGPDALLIDCTLGMGGHTEAALSRFPGLRVIGIDRDSDAIAKASERLAPFGSRFQAVHAVYDQIDSIVAEQGRLACGVLMDLGVSSWQLDAATRGFSYAKAAPLDMRMDQSSPVTAQSLLATASVGELSRILRQYGEERFANKIANAIVDFRQKEPLVDTAQLAQLVKDSIPAAARRQGGNPAKRTFQALRIAVNGELDSLTAALPAAIASLRVGGRIVVESYQSLEDRIVKQIFQARASDTAPAGLPVVPAEYGPTLRLLTKGAQKADETEIAHNSRAASVRLRAAEVIRKETNSGSNK